MSRLVKKRDSVTLRVAVQRDENTFLLLARSVRHRDVPDKISGYVRGKVDTSGFVIKWLPQMDACLVTYLVFVSAGKSLPQMLYRKFGENRCKILGNIQRVLESESSK